MLKRLLTLLAAVLTIAMLGGVEAEAQARKPSQALRQVNDEEARLLKSFDKELGQGAAQPYEWDDRVESLTAFAAQRARGFTPADWQGDEALALGRLFQRAEAYASAIESYRIFLRGEPKGRQAEGARDGLARCLIEMDDLDEAEKLLEAWPETPRENPARKLNRVALQKELALRLRDRGLLGRAATAARKGYLIIDTIDFDETAAATLQDPAQREQVALAALAIALFERDGRADEANNLRKLVETYDFGRQPALKTVYEGELAAERLIGKPAPELVVSRWLDAEGMSLRGLRGKVVLLDFWAMWCAPCVSSYSHWRAVQTKFEGRGIQVLGVTRFFGRSDTEENLRREQEFKALQAYKIKYKQLWPIAVGRIDDPTNDEAYGVIGLPTVVLLDRAGRVRNLFRGPGQHAKIEARIKQLLDEKPQ